MIWPPDRLWLTPAPVYCAFYDLHGLKNPNCSRFVEPSGLSWYLVACWRIVVDIESETGTSGAARNLVQLFARRSSLWEQADFLQTCTQDFMMMWKYQRLAFEMTKAIKESNRFWFRSINIYHPLNTWDILLYTFMWLPLNWSLNSSK